MDRFIDRARGQIDLHLQGADSQKSQPLYHGLLHMTGHRRRREREDDERAHLCGEEWNDLLISSSYRRRGAAAVFA